MCSDYIDPSVEEDLLNSRYIMLNQNGVNEVVELIKNKNKDIENLFSIIKKARAKLEIMFDNADENTVLDDLLELDKILEINKED